jgi:mgtE-like transporter
MGMRRFTRSNLVRTTEQALLSYLFNIGGIVAGSIVALSLGLFSSEPWIIALYPGIVSIRGVIGGLFSGHLSTGLHLGTIPTTLFGEGTKRFYLLWSTVIVLTLESSIFLGLVAIVFNVILLGGSIMSALMILGTLIATMGISILIISPVTMVIAFSSFKKGLDPDIVVYPIESTMADMLVTLCYALVLNVLFFVNLGGLVVSVICTVFAGVVILIYYRNRKEPEFLKTIRETFYTLVIVAFIVNVTGSVLSRIGEIVGRRPEIYVVYPALIDTMGDVGAVVGSTATTKLALGSLAPSFRAMRNHANQIVGAWAASAAMYVLYAFVGSLAQANPSLSAALRFTGLLLATNVFAAIFMIAISFAVAILTFRKGLDPDNFVIPIESSLADTLTTISLLIMLGLVGGI